MSSSWGPEIAQSPARWPAHVNIVFRSRRHKLMSDQWLSCPIKQNKTPRNGWKRANPIRQLVAPGHLHGHTTRGAGFQAAPPSERRKACNRRSASSLFRIVDEELGAGGAALAHCRACVCPPLQSSALRRQVPLLGRGLTWEPRLFSSILASGALNDLKGSPTIPQANDSTLRREAADESYCVRVPRLA